MNPFKCCNPWDHRLSPTFSQPPQKLSTQLLQTSVLGACNPLGSPECTSPNLFLSLALSITAPTLGIPANMTSQQWENCENISPDYTFKHTGKEGPFIVQHILTSLNRPQNTLSLGNLKEKKVPCQICIPSAVIQLYRHSDCMSFLTLTISKDQLPVVPYLVGMRQVLETKMTRWQGAVLSQAASGLELTVTRCSCVTLGKCLHFCVAHFSLISLRIIVRVN